MTEQFNRGSIEQYSSVRVEWEAHSLINGVTVMIFKRDGVTTSWLQLKENESLATLLIPQSFADAAWTRLRIGDILISDKTHTIVLKQDQSSVDFAEIDIDQITLATDSPKYRPYEKLEVTDDPNSNTPALQVQKAQAKQNIATFVRPAINGESSDFLGKAILIRKLNSSNIYYIPVTQEMVEATRIDGDPQAIDSQFIPNPANKLFNSIAGKINLIKEGDYLIVQQDPDGALTYLSQNFGKTVQLAQSGSDLKIGPADESLSSLIRANLTQTKNPKTVIDKVRKFAVRKLSSFARIIYPNSITSPNKPDLAIPEALRIKTISLKPDGNQNPITQWLETIFFEHEINRLLNLIYPSKISDTVITNFVQENWDQKVPEEWMFANLESLPESPKEILPIIAAFEAAEIVGRRAAKIHRTLVLFALAELANQDAQQYRENLFSLLPESLQRIELNSIISGIVDSLDPSIKKSLTFEIVPKHPFQTAIEIEFGEIIAEGVVERVDLRNMQKLVVPESGDVVIALELCPLYEDIGGNKLSQYARPVPVEQEGENVIINSMVGTKWLATKASLAKLAEICAKTGIKLKVRAVFADLGVVVTSKDFIDEQALRNQAALYRRLLEEFCNKLGVGLEYFTFSDFMKPNQPILPQFVVVEDGTTVSTPNNLAELIAMAGLIEFIDLSRIPSGQQKQMYALLKDRLENSSNNLDLYRTLVLSYTLMLKHVMEGRLTDQQISQPHIRLGMEIVDSFLLLTRLVPDFPQSTMPAINTLAKKNQHLELKILS